MSQQLYGFFDSTALDERDYSEVDMARALRMIAGDGVMGLGDNLRVISAQDGLHTRVLFGSAMCQGYYYELQDDGGSPLTLAHEASPSLPRIDRVVLRLDRNANARKIALAIHPGVPGTAPQPPALDRDDVVYELSLAQVRVATGAGILSDENITDERGDENVCGILAPARVEKLFGQLNARSIPTATAGQNIQQTLDAQSSLANKHASRHASGGADAVTPAAIGAATSSHNHDAGNVNSGRLALARIPTSGTANRVLAVGGTASADPAYAQVNLANMVIGVLPLANGGTGANTAVAARTQLGLQNGAEMKIQHGQVIITTSGGIGSATISFSPAFSSGTSYFVTGIVWSNAPQNSYILTTSGVYASNVTLHLSSSANHAHNLFWIAIGT